MTGNVRLLGLDGLKARLVGMQARVKAAPRLLSEGVEHTLTPLVAAEAPRRTGELADGTTVSIEIINGHLTIVYRSRAAYAGFVIAGTGTKHTPDPHQAWNVYGLQIFEQDGQLVATMHTHHEGQDPNNYPKRAFERANPAIHALFIALGRHILIG